MEQSQHVRLGEGSDPVDTTGLCLLSLDGGGVRGLSTLYILKNIFTRLNYERSHTGSPPVKPCQVFDLIGGTSTGGLLAIMLGRLEMDIDECILCYTELMRNVFNRKKSRLPLTWRGNTKGRFDSSKLKGAIEEVITGRDLSKQDLLNDGNVRRCRVFVCATAIETTGTIRLRSYDSPEGINVTPTICEASLATSAATSFFEPVRVGARKFVDGALNANNPADEVEREASNIWCSATVQQELKPLVKCFVSIGTGNPGKKAIEDNMVKFLARTLVAIATETERTAESFIDRWRQQYEQKRYFRFNVDQGLQRVGLEEYKEQGTIEAVTDEYLRETEQKSRVGDCSRNLARKQNETEPDFAGNVNEYHTRRTIALHSGLHPQTGNVHWTVNRSPNNLFTGRNDILCELETMIRNRLRDSSRIDQCSIVISGMGGQGKSELCLQLAHRVRQSFWGVFWVDVSTASSAKNDFLSIASKLSIPAQSIEEALQGLANVKESWLLVLDNADDNDFDYQCYFPAGLSSVVLMTSRNAECRQYASTTPVELEGLPEDDAKDLLLRAAKIPLDQLQIIWEDAQSVAKLLQSHPLALIQAGAYISCGHCTMAEYPQVYQRQRKRLLRYRPNQTRSRYGDVYATFEASADALQVQASHKEEARDALQLLPILGTCAASQLPLHLFEAAWEIAQKIDSSNDASHDNALLLTSWHVSHLPSFLQAAADAWDPYRLVEAIGLLKAFSLVSTEPYDGFLSVSMHPLTNAWARDRLDRTAQHDAWIATGCLMAMSRRFGSETLWRKHGRQLQPHLEPLTSWDIRDITASQPQRKVTSIVLGCGWLLQTLRVDAKLLNLISKLMESLTLNPLNVDVRWLPVYLIFASSLRDSGQHRKAISVLEQMVDIDRQTLAESHLDRLSLQYQLAGAYTLNRQERKAIPLLEQVVQIQKQELAENHPHRLISQHELARAYLENGQVEKAVHLLEQVVQIKEKLAKNHPDRLTSQHELARAYLENGQVEKAVHLLEQVVQIREQELAENHPHRLISQHNLAVTFWKLDRRDDALQMMKHVVEVREKVLDKSHPSRIRSEECLELFENEMGIIKPA